MSYITERYDIHHKILDAWSEMDDHKKQRLGDRGITHGDMEFLARLAADALVPEPDAEEEAARQKRSAIIEDIDYGDDIG